MRSSTWLVGFGEQGRRQWGEPCVWQMIELLRLFEVEGVGAWQGSEKQVGISRAPKCQNRRENLHTKEAENPQECCLIM